MWLKKASNSYVNEEDIQEVIRDSAGFLWLWR